MYEVVFFVKCVSVGFIDIIMSVQYIYIYIYSNWGHKRIEIKMSV